MAETKDYLLGKIKQAVEACKALEAEAEKQDRDMTDDELAEFKANVAKIEDWQVEVKRIEDREEMRKQLDALGSVAHVATAEAEQVPAKSIGEAFVQSSEYKAILDETVRTGMPRFETGPIEMKAAGDPVLESDGTNADAIAPTWFGLETPGLVQWRSLIQSVLNTVQIGTGNTANYPVVTTRTLAAGNPTAEGATKVGASFAFNYESETLVKHTAFGGASEEMFQDAPTLVNYINTELGFMALQAEEATVLQTLWTAVTQSSDGSSVQATPTLYDAVREGIATIAINGGVANALLINPMDAAVLDTTQASGVGYFSGGPYQAAATGLWGQIRRIETPALAAGTAILGDFNRGARLFRKGGLRVDSSNSHDTYFAENKIAIRAEIRSVLGVTYPEFFTEVVLGTS